MESNSISNNLYSLTQIPHVIFTMDRNERIAYLSKIREYLFNSKKLIKQATQFEKDNVDLNILDHPMSVFMMAYYGVSVKELISEYVSIYKMVFADFINKTNMKYCCKNPYNKPYKKILFCSGRLSNYSSVFRSTYEIINHLSKVSDFHVDVMTKFPIPDDIRAGYSNCKNLYELKLIRHNIDIIASNRYDIIVYPDMNMDEVTSCIGLFRLAPIQITTFGHSETSGLADYFVTSKQYEVDAANNYTEKVAQFDSLALKYKRIDIQDQIKNFTNRCYFQIPQNCNLYYCNSSCFKFGKEMFNIFKGILDEDKNAIIALTKLGMNYWDLTFFDFLDKYLPLEYKNRIRFLPRLNYWENINLLYLSDVFIESYPFGNMNSSLECFATGLPVVSMPTTKINGRFTHAYYKKMDLEKQYCVSNETDYINKAVEIATNKNKQKKEELMAKSSILFEEEESVIEWENFLRKL
jgi:protein O-GlcNAc transferase